MSIGFDPIVVPIGPWAVRAFGVLALLGLGAGIWLTLEQARAHGFNREPLLRALAWAIPGGVLSARIVSVLGWWDFYLLHLDQVPRLSPEGLSLWGGLAGGGLIAAASVRWRRRWFDLAAPGLALGIAIGRIGQFLDGYGQGLPASVPWATQYTSRLMASPDFGVPRHPVQVYDGLIALGLFVLLSRAPLRWRATLFLTTYSAASLALAPVRLEPPFLFGLQIEQLLSASALGIGLVLGARLVGRPVALRRTENVAA